MEDKKEEMDEVISFFLRKFTEQSLFKSSAEHWLSTGKASGSFRESLHAMLESWAGKINLFYKSENASLRESLSASERLRKSDAMSHMNEANALREQVDKLNKFLSFAERANSEYGKEIESLRAELDSMRQVLGDLMCNVEVRANISSSLESLADSLLSPPKQ